MPIPGPGERDEEIARLHLPTIDRDPGYGEISTRQGAAHSLSDVAAAP